VKPTDAVLDLCVPCFGFIDRRTFDGGVSDWRWPSLHVQIDERRRDFESGGLDWRMCYDLGTHFVGHLHDFVRLGILQNSSIAHEPRDAEN
jgi:hypothetical protein